MEGCFYKYAKDGFCSMRYATSEITRKLSSTRDSLFLFWDDVLIGIQLDSHLSFSIISLDPPYVLLYNFRDID